MAFSFRFIYAPIYLFMHTFLFSFDKHFFKVPTIGQVLAMQVVLDLQR